MTEFAERAAEAGLKLCYHHHMGTIVQSEADIDAFMAHTRPPVHLLLDTGHATLGRRRPGGARARLSRPHRPRPLQGRARGEDGASRTPATGASSIRSSASGRELGVYTVPGDGMIDYVAVFRELRGYSGWVVLEAEQDPKKAPALPYAQKGRRASARGVAATGGLDVSRT